MAATLLFATAIVLEQRTGKFNPTGLTKEQYIAMTPQERNAYDINNADRLASEGIITQEQVASIKETIKARA